MKPFVSKNLEIIYVSHDQADEQYQKHLVELGNWLSIPFGDQRNEQLKQMYKVFSIPQVIVVSSKSGKVISKNARQDIF